MPKTQKKVPATWLYTIGKFILKPYYSLVYRIKAEGLENFPKEGPVLLCSNHLTMKDPLLLGILLKRQIFYMGKEELFRSKFLGGLLRMLGVFPVARGTGGEEALQTACDLLEAGAVVGIFIEGTRSKTGELGRPKNGAALLAAQTQTDVVPACITGETGTFPKAFRRTIIKFGNVLTPGQMGIETAGATNMRRASRAIMGEITRLREESRREFGLPALPETAEQQGGEQK